MPNNTQTHDAFPFSEAYHEATEAGRLDGIDSDRWKPDSIELIGTAANLAESWLVEHASKFDVKT